MHQDPGAGAATPRGVVVVLVTMVAVRMLVVGGAAVAFLGVAGTISRGAVVAYFVVVAVIAAALAVGRVVLARRS